MSFMDDPLYKNMIEGDDTHMLVGILTTRMREPNSPGVEILPVVMVDYHQGSEMMESFAAKTFDPVKKILLSVKDGVYRIEVEERGTTVVFSGPHTAVHSAPNFWAEYTPSPDEHEAFQSVFAKTGVWVLMVATRQSLREHLIDKSGDVLYRKTLPLTDDLRKTLRLDE